MAPLGRCAPAEAFDDAGEIKKEFWETEHVAAYPEGHSVWTKLVVPDPAMTLMDFAAWLKDEHGVKLTNWSVTTGYRLDDDGKQQPIATKVREPRGRLRDRDRAEVFIV